MSKINVSFKKYYEEIGCQGEVRLFECSSEQKQPAIAREDPELAPVNDEFDKFELQIWVSYRADVGLQQLSATAQSGGVC